MADKLATQFIENTAPTNDRGVCIFNEVNGQRERLSIQEFFDRFSIGVDAGTGEIALKGDVYSGGNTSLVPPYPTFASQNNPYIQISPSTSSAVATYIPSLLLAHNQTGINFPVGNVHFINEASLLSEKRLAQIEVKTSGTVDSGVMELKTYSSGTANTSISINPTGAVTLSSLGTGTVYSNGGTLTNTNPSDKRLKEKVKAYNAGLAELIQLEPKEFSYKGETPTKFGYLADDVQLIMPEVVCTFKKEGDETEYLGLETEGINAAVINALKEVADRIDKLEKKK